MKHRKKAVWLIVLLLMFPQQAFAWKVMIDAGHGGTDPGAIGVNGLQEKTVNLSTALKLRDELSKRGYEVLMTRTDDRYLTLSERVERTKAAKPDLFVSIHANATSSPSTRGTMVLYYDKDYPQASYPASAEMTSLTPKSKALASAVLREVLAQTSTPSLNIRPDAAYVVRKGDVPSILVESAFLTNPLEASMLATDSFRSKVAVGIANGIDVYLSTVAPEVFPDTAGHWAREAIIDLKELGIVSGSGNRFNPDRPLTRAELLSMLDKVFAFDEKLGAASQDTQDELSQSTDSGNGENANGTAPVSSEAADADGNEVQTADTQNEPVAENVSFSDLNETHWAYPIIMKAQQLQMISGYPDGTIRPDQAITRSEVAVLFDSIWKQDKNMIPVDLTNANNVVFTDVSVNEWYANAVYTLQKANIIHGVSSTEYAPGRQMTRAEAAALIDNYLKTNDAVQVAMK